MATGRNQLKMFDKNVSKSSSKRDIRDSILSPEKGAHEPLLILKLSADVTAHRDGATGYAQVHDIASKVRGYIVINSTEIVINNDESKIYKKNSNIPLSSQEELKSIILSSYQHKQEPMTIWIEGHSAPGWVFSANADHKAENNAAIAFRKKILEIEEATGRVVKNIIINSCNSATEIVYNINENEQSYINSSARLLSLLFPDKHILGFIGYNSTSTTKINKKSEEGVIEEITLPIKEASILFKSGEAIEYSAHENIFIGGAALKPFLLKTCQIKPDNSILHILNTIPKKDKLSSYKNNYLFVNNTLYYINNKKTVIEVPLTDINLLTSLPTFQKIQGRLLPQKMPLTSSEIMTCILSNTTNIEHYPTAASQQFSVCLARETMMKSLKPNSLQECYANKQYSGFANKEKTLKKEEIKLKEEQNKAKKPLTT
ncbi:MAG: hypothetical protein KIT56_07840 [Gammaproteobacteria bacterium]|nr:hypothetical protein [Gammaproteobacteria bacterium]MCW5583771.1 hypothetical protein [Gammaproteobacteria bacterium]